MDKSKQSNNKIMDQASQEQHSAAPGILVEKPNVAGDDQLPREVNGPRGLEPTRYGDWEANGRCYDF